MPPDQKQFPPSGHVFVAMVLSIALWAVMVFWTFAYLRRISGGLEPFDLRPFGYTTEDARALLYALSPIGRAYYADVQLQLDTIYLGVYALSRAFLLLWLTIPGRTAAKPLPLAARAALVCLPVVTAAFDYLENDGIAAMLAAGPQVAAAVVASASFWSQAKSLAGALTEAICVVLLVVAFVRWQHRRRRGP
jgi:hypothetical protein